MESAYGPGFGRPTITAVDAERSDVVLRDLLDLRDAVLAGQDVPGRSKQQCYAAVRSAIARSTEISDLSPVAAAVLAEIQLHIGRLPLFSEPLVLGAGARGGGGGVLADLSDSEGFSEHESEHESSALGPADLSLLLQG